MKLTRAMRETLLACPDWSAPFEVAARRRASFGIIVYERQTRRRMIDLHMSGLLDYGPANDTYRITPAGRLALQEKNDG